jgi:hypothetical protein
MCRDSQLGAEDAEFSLSVADQTCQDDNLLRVIPSRGKVWAYTAHYVHLRAHVYDQAVLFFSSTPDGSNNQLSLHGGCRVKAGVKWLAQKWFHAEVSLFCVNLSNICIAALQLLFGHTPPFL